MSTDPPASTHTRSVSLTSLTSLAPSSKTVQSYLIPLLILFGIAIASATQTEVAHHVTADIGYNQPYFTFFLTHITFSLIFPVHLAILFLFRPDPAKSYIDGLRRVIANQLGEPEDAGWKTFGWRWVGKVAGLTLLISVPALSWFVAMVYTSTMDATSIYATSSFHAYFFSMLLLKVALNRTTLASIALAFGGVIVISFAGAGGDQAGASNRLLGDVVMMIGELGLISSKSIGLMRLGALLLGLYEVVYKMALPEGNGGIASKPTKTTARYAPLDADEQEEPDFTPPESRSVTPPLDKRTESTKDPRRIYSKARGPSTNSIPLSPSFRLHDRLASSSPLLPTSIQQVSARQPSSPPPSDSVDIPLEHPNLPKGFHSNFITSCIGAATLAALWLPCILLDILGWEPFRWPGTWRLWADLGIISTSGAVYVSLNPIVSLFLVDMGLEFRMRD